MSEIPQFEKLSPAEQVKYDLMVVVRDYFQSNPPGRQKVLDVLDGLAKAAATIIVGTKEDSDSVYADFIERLDEEITRHQ
jgi:hypothetical protein